MKPESIFQQRVLRDLKKLPYTWILKTQEKTRRGVPDIIMSMSGYFIAIELKASQKAVVAPLQCYEIAAIQHTGARAFIAYPENWTQIFHELEKFIGIK